MKKFTFYRFILIISIFTIAFIAWDNPTDDKINSSVIGGSKKEVKLSRNDQRFLVEAYTSGLFQISLANEAQIRSTSAESMQLSKAVSEFHSNRNNKIREIADEHGLTLPMDLTDDQKLVWKQVIKEKGWNFDKRYSDLLEKLKVIETSLYSEATQNTSDKNVMLLVQKSLPELQPHQSLHEKLCQRIQEKRVGVVAENDEKDNASMKKKSSAPKS